MSIRSGGQVELLLWAAAEARRLRADPRNAAARPAQASPVRELAPEQFTTEWQTVYFAESAS